MSDHILDDLKIFAALPNLRIDRDNIAHYRGLLAGKLLINRCQACGYWIYPHRPVCPECLSWDIVPTEVSGRGRLFMYTLIHRARDPNTPLTEPLVVAAVDLEERQGLRYLSTVVNCPPHRLAHDMPLQLTWVAQGEHQVPAFEPGPSEEGY